jgi:RNA polymerase sigma factor (sigma-70 family)
MSDSHANRNSNSRGATKITAQLAQSWARIAIDDALEMTAERRAEHEARQDGRALPDADEMTSAATLAVFQAAARWQNTPDACTLAHWCIRSAMFAVVKTILKELRGARLADSYDTEDERIEYPPPVLIDAETVERMEDAVDALPARERTAVRMHQAGRANATIAAHLGVSERHAGRILAHALDTLRRTLKGDDD